MSYDFQFAAVWAARDELAWGALLTLELSAVSMVLSLIIAVLGAFGRTAGPAPLRAAIAAYVDAVRNTPFLVQVFLIFFGLPAIGVRLDANTGALIAMVLNGSAYTIEIVRAGIEAVGHGQVEAAGALGLHRFQVFRLVVLPQALRTIFAPLGSQFILLMLNSSVVSVISADELMAAAQDVQSRTFRSFETYIVVTIIYLALASLFSAVFNGLNRRFFPDLARSYCARSISATSFSWLPPSGGHSRFLPWRFSGVACWAPQLRCSGSPRTVGRVGSPPAISACSRAPRCCCNCFWCFSARTCWAFPSGHGCRPPSASA